MAEAAIVGTIKRYLAALPPRGIRSRRAVLYGSHAKGTADEWSDIDPHRTYSLWRARMGNG
ncbi:MAG: nucleotidyltransferase domain-containing protein [Candidatus Hydrogenedentes bacterium]|nr:nucleotidyltransferase domain-containing protein [Candidatus Hydrogenedentota bacterium]